MQNSLQIDFKICFLRNVLIRVPAYRVNCMVNLRYATVYLKRFLMVPNA